MLILLLATPPAHAQQDQQDQQTMRDALKAARARLVRPSLALVPSGAGTPPEPTLKAERKLGAPADMPKAVCGPTPPASPASPPLRRSTDALPYRPFPATWQRRIDGLAANNSIPGAVIIVKSPDWGVRVGVAGVANLVSHEPMSPDLQFRVGSVSKAFLAQAILRLEQEGKLKLTDTLLTHLGDNPIVAGIPDAGRITVANLLQMTSGTANYLDATSIAYSPQVTPDRAFTPDDLMGVLSANGPAVPGLPSGQPLVGPYFDPGATYPNPFWKRSCSSSPPRRRRRPIRCGSTRTRTTSSWA